MTDTIEISVPYRMGLLPRAADGSVAPFFLTRVDGVPQAGQTDVPRVEVARHGRLCLMCGGPLGRWGAFPVWPSALLTQVVVEPPSHGDCAEWAARAWPKMRGTGPVAVWGTRDWAFFPGPEGWRTSIGRPESVTWWLDGRPAFRGDVLAALDAETEAQIAGAEHDEGRDRVRAGREKANAWLPAE